MAGWDRIEADTWEIVMERLPRPLLREEAAQDLRWWAGQKKLGVAQRPSLRVLAKRWGWLTSSGKPAIKRVRLLLSGGEWEDPHQKGHGEGTVGARSGHGEGTPNTGKPSESGEKGHGEGTVGARSGHDEGPTRVVDPPTPTPTPKDPPKPPKGGSGKGRTGRPVEEELPHVIEVWNTYREHHPRCDNTPSDSVATRIVWALRQRVKVNAASTNDRARSAPMTAAVKQVQLVIDWAHTAPSAYYLQGFYDNGKVKNKKGWLGITNILKKEKFSDNLEAAREWLDAGRPRNPMLDQQHNGQHREIGQALWVRILGMLPTHGRRPDVTQFADNEADARAADAALSKVAPWADLHRADNFTMRGYEQAFLQQFVSIRGGS